MLLLLLYPKHVIKLSGYNLRCYKLSILVTLGNFTLLMGGIVKFCNAP